MNNEDIAQPTKEAVPFKNNWWRCERCEFKEIEARRYVDDGALREYAKKGTIEFALTKGRQHYWVVEFSGKVKQYTPSKETLDDALRLKLPTSPQDEPSTEITEFFKKWGALGLWHMVCPGYLPVKTEEKPRPIIRPRIGRNDIPYEYALKIKEEMPYKDFWYMFHNQDTTPEYLAHWKPRMFFKGYREYWFILLGELENLQHAWGMSQRRHSYTLLNAYAYQYLRVQVDKDDYGTYWALEFRSLRDALYGLAARELIGGRPWLTCRYCGCPFRLGRKRTFCSEDCRLRYYREKAERKPLEKGKRRLRGKLETAVGNGEIGDVTEKRIREEINKAQNEKDLQRVAASYKEVFRNRKRGRPPKTTSSALVYEDNRRGKK